MAQRNPFVDSAGRHPGIVHRTAGVAIALVIAAMIGFPAWIAPHLDEPIVVSLAGPRAPVAADEYLTADQVVESGWWWLVPVVIFLFVYAYGVRARRTGVILTGAAGLAAFGSIYAGRYAGIAVTNAADLSPGLQPAFCLLLYIVLSSPFLMAFIGDRGSSGTA